jgi:Putative DNA-binding domain
MPSYLSSARSFFEFLRSHGNAFDYLSELPNGPEPFFEEEWIDFKGQPRNDNDAKVIWSKALSGYANMTDGLVVWGVDARKTPPKDIDAACGLRLIQNPHRFVSNLRDWIRDATNPPVMGIEYLTYPGPSDEGFVVAFIPQSGHKPHRSEWPSKQYYYRAGDDFLAAEPSMLRFLFHPRYTPRFNIRISFRFNLQRPATAGNLRPMMEISNSGNASAHDIFIECSHNGKDAFPNLPDPWLINRSHWKVIENGIDRLGVMALVPLHPSHSLPFIEGAPFFVRLRNKIPDLGTSPLLPTFSDLRFTLNVYARDAAPARYSASFSEQDFDDANPCVKECEIVD